MKIKKHLYIFFLLIISFNINAKFIDIDDEINKLNNYLAEKGSKEKSKEILNYLINDGSQYNDLKKIDLLVRLEDSTFHFALLEEINKIAEKGISLSKKNNNYKLEYFYYYKGIYQEETGEKIEDVIKTYKESLKYALIHENRKLINTIYETIGDLYSYDKNIKLAFDNYKMASHYVNNKAEDFKLKYKISKIFYYFNVNIISYDESLKLLKEIKSESQEMDSKIGNNLLIYIYENLTLILIKEKKYNEALKYAKLNLSEAKKSTDIYDKIVSLLLISLVNSHLNKFEIAYEQIKLAENYIEEEEIQLQFIFFNLKYAKFYYFYLNNEHEKAENEILELEFYLESENQNKEALYSIYNKISKNLYKLKKYDKALKYQKEYTDNYINKRNVEETSLSLFLHENYKSKKLLNEKNEIIQLKKDKINEIFKNEIEQKEKNKIFKITILIIFVFLIFLFILIKLYKKNKKISITDDLTNLYNRRFFVNKTKEFIKNNELISIAIADIDDFKKINDKYGHCVGDKILIEFSEIIKNNVSSEEIVSRIGGEEFTIIFKDNKIKTKEKLERIRKKIQDHEFSNNIKITSSFGVEDSENTCFNDIYLKADKNLYKAKKDGKNKIF